MNPITIAILLSFGVGAVVIAGRNTAPQPQPTPQPLPFPPNPNPLPLPSVPNPQQGSVEGLLAQAQVLLAQAAQSPDSVDPNQLDALAASLRVAGQPAVAQQLESEAAAIRLRKGGLPIGSGAPSPQTTALDQQAFLIGAGIEAAIRNQVPPTQIDVQTAQLLLPALTAAGLTARADQFQTLISRVQAARLPGGLPLNMNPNPSTLPDTVAARIAAVTNPQNPLATSKEADALLQSMNHNYPTGFLAEKQALQRALIDLTNQGR